jgi:hypothetical protein
MTSADPVVGDPLSGQSWNRYSYVFNNPLAYTDPTGYCPVCIGTVNPPAAEQRRRRRGDGAFGSHWRASWAARSAQERPARKMCPGCSQAAILVEEIGSII